MATTVADGLRCTFCGKHQEQLKKLIAGPGVYICNECVDLCNEIIAEELSATEVRRRVTGTTRPDPAPALIANLDALTDAQLIDLMVRIHASHAGVDHSVQRVVAALRVRSISWARIGEALGMTRQSAWERFSGED